MATAGTVLKIFTCGEKEEPMISRASVWAIAGFGLEGDRYALGKGAFSKSPRITVRHVSLIASEAIDEANRDRASLFTPEDTRRNILTQGIDPNDLVGKVFRIGNVVFRGVELCKPCNRPSVLCKKPGFEAAFENRGGLRAEIFNDGMISVGDDIVVF